ncbi:MAG: transposase [Calditrichales bacterium]|nr:transposase [Calditrichales bacterium]
MVYRFTRNRKTKITDKSWDGLKGYISNAKLNSKEVIENYKNLWHIERAFRMSKTDLRIRPIYHRLKHRVEAHICVSFTAYTIYKELERILKKEKSTLSVKKAAELTHNMYEISYILPDSRQMKSRLLKMDDSQAELHHLTLKNY